MFKDKMLEKFKDDLEDPQGFNNAWFEITSNLAAIVQILIEKNIVTEKEFNEIRDFFKNKAKEISLKQFEQILDDKKEK